MIYQDRQSLTKAIKASLAIQGLTFETVASRLGVSPSSLSRTVNRSDMTFGTAARIAQAMGLRLVFSFEEESESKTAIPGNI